jgi:hypothetical protein
MAALPFWAVFWGAIGYWRCYGVRFNKYKRNDLEGIGRKYMYQFQPGEVRARPVSRSAQFRRGPRISSITRFHIEYVLNPVQPTQCAKGIDSENRRKPWQNIHFRASIIGSTNGLHQELYRSGWLLKSGSIPGYQRYYRPRRRRMPRNQNMIRKSKRAMVVVKE